MMKKNTKAIHSFLESKKMHLKDFARTVGISPATVYNILNTGVIRIDTALKIIRKFEENFSIHDFDVTYPAGKVPKYPRG